MKHLYRKPAYDQAKIGMMIALQSESSPIEIMATEYCFNIEGAEKLNASERETLEWLLSETLEPENFSDKSFLSIPLLDKKFFHLLEVGPNGNVTTPWCSNVVSVCRAAGLKKIKRIERSVRFLLRTRLPWDDESLSKHLKYFYDRARECVYDKPLATFETGVVPKPVKIIPLLEEGAEALRKLNREMGLGFDDWDIDFYHNLFVNVIHKNPTDVECFDIGQSNSEHSRHWFFKGKLIVDGKEVPHTLMELIKEPHDLYPGNSRIAFSDNSSSIRGHEIEVITPVHPAWPCWFKKSVRAYDLTFTAETHNFPTGVAPFPGAETGTGGRIRDVEATGRGGLVIAGTAAYCVGNLQIPEYELPWEDKSFIYPANLASPLEIKIQASNGASDYGNKFGEPVINGFTRSFGMRLPGGERYEWLKPIMFTGGIGQMDARHVKKGEPEKGMLVVKIGGPGYRIGIGGGSASSMIQGANTAELDFNAVQRGDAEMEQKMNRVIRACVEMGKLNPIISIHDQGAGGNCNVVKEIIYPAGARILVRNIQVGDNTLSVLEIWGAEYQEQNALLLAKDNWEIFFKICEREKVPFAAIGEITGDGYITLYDERDNSTPVNLELKKILGEMPQKTFYLDHVPMKHEPLNLPDDITVRKALSRVLRLVSVGSKRFLTNKVDRSVSGLIARQQCCGPLQLTVSDCAVVAQSYLGLTGGAISNGERPLLTLLDPAAMARMSVAEALTNLVWVRISAFKDIKFSGNWMWAAKLPGEGAKLYDAAVALSDILVKLRIAIDGGKDSLSMATVVEESDGKKETVKSPGMLVMSAYVTCPDITKVITPDIKRPGESKLIFIDLAKGKCRLGGSALAQVYSQIGNECPDVEDVSLLMQSFIAIQELIDKDLILAGHDTTGDGLLVALLEMAFAGNCGFISHLNCFEDEALKRLFAEELGHVIEVEYDKEDEVASILKSYKIPFQLIGITVPEKAVHVWANNSDEKKEGNFLKTILKEDMRILRNEWEETSYRLERLQCNPACVGEERRVICNRPGPQYILSFDPEITPEEWMNATKKPKVAIIREEGSNSDREMAAAFYQAGFEPWDITMTDFLMDRISLADFRGLAFVGGFSYADVLDSAKGWAGVIRFNKKIWEEFQTFYNRPDTFSLGVCNGCQLMALLGWIPWEGIEMKFQPRFIHNKSGRFESRFSTVKILESSAIMLKGMAGSTLGIHVAHGEGRVYADRELIEMIRNNSLAPIRYVSDDGEITEQYPDNPNGSPYGIAALCDTTGRHLAIMPHPERTFLKWQWPWMPEDWRKNLNASPWLKMFQNAREWCDNKNNQ